MIEGLVSVLMPAYNCERYVKRAIQSVLDQTYSNFELLISDDASTDNTRQIIDSFNDTRIKTYHSNINRGYLKASNELFNKVKGEFLAFQDADDYSDAVRLERQIAFLNTNPEVSCVGCNMVKVNENERELFRTNYALNHNDILIAFKQHRIVMTGSALVIRMGVMKDKLYNEFFNRIGSEDLYLFSTLMERITTANLSEHYYFYRTNPTSVGNTHKDPRAYVGHELVVRMYERRLAMKDDYIQTNWKNADICARFLIAIKAIPNSKYRALKLFIQAFFEGPLISLQFFKEFFGKLNYDLQTRSE